MSALKDKYQSVGQFFKDVKRTIEDIVTRLSDVETRIDESVGGGALPQEEDETPQEGAEYDAGSGISIESNMISANLNAGTNVTITGSTDSTALTIAVPRNNWYEGPFKVEIISQSSILCNVKVYNSLLSNSSYAGKMYCGLNTYDINTATLTGLGNGDEVWFSFWYEPTGSTSVSGATQVQQTNFFYLISTEPVQQTYQSWYKRLAEIIATEDGMACIQYWYLGDAEILGRWV